MISLCVIALIPIVLAAASMILPYRSIKLILPACLWAQFALVAYITWPVLSHSQEILILQGPVEFAFRSWGLTPDFSVDRIAALFMLLSTAVSASCLSHAAHYFQAETHKLVERHVRIFYAASCLFLLTMTVVFACDNLGLLWIAVEMTTLASSPLVYFDRTKNAVEATWKYLIICSVGIAFALMGTILLFASSQHGNIEAGSMQITELVKRASSLNHELLNLGAIFCIVGYGTKAGVFPLHNWLPDAHSEAPAPASAMLSGGLLNCALFAIWRVTEILLASQSQGPIMQLAITMGAITALAASLLLIRQHSFKRMWAYSSIENVGIMLVAIGLGSGMLFFVQALNHSIAKVALFLITGNIVQANGSKDLNKLHGVIDTAPAWGIILILGTLAITGAPPFGMFISELAILVSAANPLYWPVAASLLLAVSISFVALSWHVGRVVCGGARPGYIATNQLTSSLMPGLLMFCSLLLGILVGPQFWTYLK